MSWILLPLMLGCSFLEEQRSLPTTVSWSGYVYGDLPGDDSSLLEAGTLEVVDLDDELLVSGSQSDNTAGYWGVEVPVDTDVALRVAGGSQVPTVWRSRTPTGSAYWLTGALFAVSQQTADDFFGSLDGWQGMSPDDLSQEEVAHLWGQPWEPERWQGATVLVTDSLGTAQVALLAVDEDGALIDAGTGPVDYFVAPDLEPGPVTLQVTAADGSSLQSSWPARGGDLLSAFYVALSD